MSLEEIRQLNRLLKRYREFRRPEPKVTDAIALVRHDIEFVGIASLLFDNLVKSERNAKQ